MIGRIVLPIEESITIACDRRNIIGKTLSVKMLHRQIYQIVFVNIVYSLQDLTISPYILPIAAYTLHNRHVFMEWKNPHRISPFISPVYLLY